MNPTAKPRVNLGYLTTKFGNMLQDIVDRVRSLLSDLSNSISFARPWIVSAAVLVAAVLATWLVDQRRLTVPLNYFIQQPFYNWTRRAAPTIGNVALFLDYAAPVDLIRKTAAELVAETKQDNAKVTSVQVTNASAQAIEVHILIDSDSAATTGTISADLREKLIGSLQREHPEALPRQRNEIIELSARQKAEPHTAPSPLAGG